MAPNQKSKSKWLMALLLLPLLVVVWLGPLGGDGGNRRELSANGADAARPEVPGSLEYETSSPHRETPGSTVESDAEPAERVDANLEESDPPRTAQLVVTVFDAERGDLVGGAMVAARWAEMRRWESAGGSVGRLGQAPHTNGAGVAKLEVPAERRLDVDVLSSLGEFGRQSLVVEPLVPGAVRELTVGVTPKYDAQFFGRVVTAEDGLPIVGAEVRPGAGMGYRASGKAQAGEGEPSPAAITDRDGRFDLPYWRYGTYSLKVCAAGRTPAEVALSGNATTPDARHEVRLERGARLEGTVTSALALSETLRVCVRGRLGGNLTFQDEWSGVVGPGGVFAIEDLPPEESLWVEIRSGELLVRREPEALSLEPGETHRVEWHLGSGATIRGQVLGENGVCEPRRSVLLLPASRGIGGSFSHQLFAQNLRPGTVPGSPFDGRKMATSDDQGRFSFSGIAAGEWVLGAEGGPESVSLATRLTIAPHGGEVEVTVAIRRGELISGRVLDPSGTGAGRAHVTARGLESGLRHSSTCDEEGAFRIGPLLPGRYSLLAREHGFAGSVFTGRKLSARGVVDSGDSGVVLQLADTPEEPPR